MGSRVHRNTGELAKILEARDDGVARRGIVDAKICPTAGGQRFVVIRVKEVFADDDRQLVVLLVTVIVVDPFIGRPGFGTLHRNVVGGRALDRRHEMMRAAVDTGPIGGLGLVAHPHEAVVGDDR